MKTPPRSHGKQQIRAKYSPVSRRVVLPTEEYIHSEAVAGALLLAAAVISLIWANSPWSASYFALREMVISVQIGSFSISDNFQHWVNDGLMAIFFFVVALEIKREFLFGSLSERSRAALPIAAAVGGMVVPAAFFLLINLNGGGIRGWGIPMATDIAFAVAVIALLGNRVSDKLKVLLLAFAIVDDIGAILVIAVYYTNDFSWTMILYAALLLGVILAVRWIKIKNIGIYGLLGLLFWALVLKSGVHATIAGVILGVLTPAHSTIGWQTFADALEKRLPWIRGAIRRDETAKVEAAMGQVEEITMQTESPMERLERLVHPWVNYTILPLFALTNAGFVISFDLLSDAADSPVTRGIIVGLLIGKPVGMMGASWLAVKFKFAALPENVNWKQMCGVGILGGVGFTVAIFISELAYEDHAQFLPLAHVGILTASILAAVAGYTLLRVTSRNENLKNE